MTSFSTRPVSPSDASEFERYRYPPPYDVYDSVPGSVQRFLDPESGYVSVIDAAGSLWGFGCLGVEAQVPGGQYSASSALDLGVGMSPVRAGQGFGREFCSAVAGYAAASSTGRLQVTVASFNSRSYRIWERLGFREVHRFRQPESGRSFAQLVRSSASQSVSPEA